MATTDAISAVCDTICFLLRSSMVSTDASGENSFAPRGLADTLEGQADSVFVVYTSQNFIDIDTGGNAPRVGIFLYRVTPNASNRNLVGRLNGDRYQFGQLALDLHVLVLIWAKHAATQHRLVGWVMRTLEDYPILPASVLNRGAAQVQIPGGADNNIVSSETIFKEDESIELLLGEIGSEELLQLWDTLGKGSVPFPISIPYLIRNVCIESYRQQDAEKPVQERIADLAVAEGGDV